MACDNEIVLCDVLGKVGKYQIVLLAINFLAGTFSGIAGVIIPILAPEVNIYWDWEASNPNKTIFGSNNCNLKEILEYNKTSNLSSQSSKLIYESDYSRRTLTEELNLVCERSWLISFVKFAFLFGMVFGCIFMGRLSEIYGRKPCTIWMGVAAVLSCICILFCQGYVMFLLAAFINGATAQNIPSFLCIQVIEIVPTSLAQYTGTIAKSGLLVGQALMVGVAWVFEDWFNTQIFVTAYTGAVAISVIYTLESPMWLAVRKRYQDSKDTILKIADRNNLKRDMLEHKVDMYLEQIKTRCEIQGKAEKGQYSDLFKNKVITFYTIAMCLSRASIFFIYYGLVMNAETFGSGFYVDLTISNAASLVSILLSILLLRKFSIRLQLIVFCTCEGIVCAITPFFYDIPLARSIITILGRCLVAPSMCVLFVYVTEIYPTSVRGVASGFILMIGGLASSVSPFTKELGEKTALYVPFILFAALSFMAGGLHKVMPETKGKALIHTVDELVRRKRRKSEHELQTIYSISN